MTIPDPTKLHNDLIDDITWRADRALSAGLSYEEVAYILMHMSSEAAMKGGPVPIFKHSYMLEDAGRTLRKRFRKAFPDLDEDALIRGEIVRK